MTVTLTRTTDRRPPAPAGRERSGVLSRGADAAAEYWHPTSIHETPPGRVGKALAFFATGPRASVGFVCLVAGLGGAYALGALVPFWFPSAPSAGAAFFPSAGLSVSALALTPRRTWPVWLAVFAAAGFGVDVSHHQPVAMAVGFVLANTLEPLVGALLLVAATRRSHKFRVQMASFALFPVLAAPLVGAAVGATFSVAFSASSRGWWATAANWWVGDALGVLVIGSVILAWSRVSAFEDRAPLAAIVGLMAVAAGSIVLSGALWHHPVIYVVLPALVWAAFTGGSRAVAAVGAATAAAADWAAISGRADHLFASSSTQHQVVFLQVFLGLTILTGLTLAVEVGERRRSEHLTQQAELQRTNSEAIAVKLAEAERQSITQETHDIVGHGLTAMLVQVGAARQVLDNDPALARELLASAEGIGRRACGDLDVALTLFGHHPSLKPGRGLESLPELVGVFTAAGLRVDLDVEGEDRAVPTFVDWTAYRIAREALTNVAKHAPGAAAEVTLRFGSHELCVSVVDDGGPANGTSPSEEGRGIKGMRERAAALGGTLEAGPMSGRGFAVVGKLPF